MTLLPRHKVIHDIADADIEPTLLAEMLAYERDGDVRMFTWETARLYTPGHPTNIPTGRVNVTIKALIYPREGADRADLR